MPDSPVPARPGTLRFAVSALCVTGVLALSACGGGGSPGGAGGADDRDTSGIKIRIAAEDGAMNVGLHPGVEVSGGKLTDVKLVQADNGATVKGSMAADGSSWKPSAELERGTKYKLVANAKDGKGRPATENRTFTTVSPKNSFIGSYTPDGGKTVGVGMPVSFNFDKAIADKKNVQSHITVTSSSGQKVVGHWFGSQRLDFRPEQYW
ncbi:Ig-like domain-containing protein, partial [Streptomyces rimosus]|uniref:Ig-like domain-containing protein n=1 Tax=Streptomyces rimosus TaxID=1927 RepID=UPI001F23DC15